MPNRHFVFETVACVGKKTQTICKMLNLSTASASAGASSSSSSVVSQTSSNNSQNGSFRSVSSTSWDMTHNNNNNQTADQPLPNMTVREYLEKIGKEAEQRIMSKANAQNNALWKSFERQKQGLLALHEQQHLLQADFSSENANPFLNSGASQEDLSAAVVHSAEKKQKISEFTVKLEIHYEQDVHLVEVCVAQEREAKVGRSRGKQFQPGAGISLHWDQEVSTTHGRFFVHTKSNRVCFEDLGSTNKTNMSSGEGTRVLEKFKPVAVHAGDTLYLGASTMRVLEIIPS